jgi:hypothetical protein
MRRTELEHIIRIAAAISEEREFVVLEESSLLASVSEPPAEVQRAAAVDLYPMRVPELAALFESSIGELSAFHEQFGYYARGVGPQTSILPEGWQSRLVKLPNDKTNKATAYCLEPHDLAASKLAANHDTDLVATLVREKIVDPTVLADRIDYLPLPLDCIRRLKACLARAVAASAGQGSHDADNDGPDI